MKYQIQNVCIAGMTVFVPANSFDINVTTPIISQYTMQDSSYRSREYIQETEDNANFIKKALMSEAKKDLLAKEVKILYEDIASDYVEGFGDILFCDITVETNNSFTVQDMLELNAGIIKKHSLIDNNIVFTLHTA